MTSFRCDNIAGRRVPTAGRVSSAVTPPPRPPPTPGPCALAAQESFDTGAPCRAARAATRQRTLRPAAESPIRGLARGALQPQISPAVAACRREAGPGGAGRSRLGYESGFGVPASPRPPLPVSPPARPPASTPFSLAGCLKDPSRSVLGPGAGPAGVAVMPANGKGVDPPSPIDQLRVADVRILTNHPFHALCCSNTLFQSQISLHIIKSSLVWSTRRFWPGKRPPLCWNQLRRGVASFAQRFKWSHHEEGLR